MEGEALLSAVLAVTMRTVQSVVVVKTRQHLPDGPCLQTPVTPDRSINCLHFSPATALSASNARTDLFNHLYSLTTVDCVMQTKSTYHSLLNVNYAAMHGLLQGSSALMAAAAWGHLTIVKLLLTQRADPAMKNKKVRAQHPSRCKLHVCCRVLSAHNTALGGGGGPIMGKEKEGRAGGGGGVCKHVSAFCALTDVPLFHQSTLQACDRSSSARFDSRHQMYPVQIFGCIVLLQTDMCSEDSQGHVPACQNVRCVNV